MEFKQLAPEAGDCTIELVGNPKVPTPVKELVVNPILWDTIPVWRNLWGNEGIKT